MGPRGHVAILSDGLRSPHTASHSGGGSLRPHPQGTGPVSPRPHHHPLLCFFDYIHSDRCEVSITVGLTCTPLMIRDAEHLCTCFWPPGTSSFMEGQFRSFAHILTKVLVFLVTWRT